jgi:hypothetical protein
MTIILNCGYGIFALPDDFCAEHGLKRYDDIDRTDKRLVDYVINHGGEVKFNNTDLVAVNVPDNATDWCIQEYDGAEDVICVVNGKICRPEIR